MRGIVAIVFFLAGAYLIDAHWYQGTYLRAARSMTSQIWVSMLR